MSPERALTAYPGRVIPVGLSQAARRARYPGCAQDKGERTVSGVGCTALCRPERLAHARSAATMQTGRITVRASEPAPFRKERVSNRQTSVAADKPSS